MRVLITGGPGLIGKAIAERLLQTGRQVRLLDIADAAEISGAEYARCDILDYDGLLKQMHGCDAVIHLAALRSPHLAPAHRVFEVNVAGTFNVFEAAAAAGIRRVVQASSINALGAFYSTGDIEPRYFPIDEAHPCFTTDPYSFSKQMIEEVGAYYWRRDGISSVALRFPAVFSTEYMASEVYRQRREKTRRLLDELVSLPESELRARLAAVRQQALDYRRERHFEYRPGQAQWVNDPLFDDALFRAYVSDRFNFWAFVDIRDAAQSLDRGLTAEFEGSHALFINASHNEPDYDTRTLIRLFFPELSHFKSDLPGSAALVSIDRARTLIGFEPEYSINDRWPVS